jgi:hypothetical protein
MIRMLGFGTALLFLLPISLLGQNKGNGAGKVIPGTPDEYAQLKKVSNTVAKLAAVDPGSAAKSMTLDIQYFFPAPANHKGRTYQPRPGGGFRPVGGGGGANLQNQWNNLVRQQQQLANSKNPKQYQQRLQQLLTQMQKLQVQMVQQQMRQVMYMNRLFNQAAIQAAPNVKIASGFKEFDVEAIDNVVVRRLNLPFEYDDKGNVKKYTKDELDKLKGKDKSLPGYEAKYEDLQAGQIVRVYMVKPKAKPKDDPKADKNDPKVDKVEGKDKKGEDMQPDPPQVRMIVILADADPNARDNPRPKKKKDQ